MRICALKILSVLRLFLLPVVHSSAAPGVGPPLLAWTDRDIGNTSLVGSYSSSSATIEVTGSGADIWGAADGFHFVYASWYGDVEFIARVVNVQNTHPWAKAGLMIRADLTEFSAHGTVAMTPEQGAALLRRQ